MPETSNRDCLAWKLMVEPLRPAPPEVFNEFLSRAGERGLPLKNRVYHHQIIKRKGPQAPNH